MSEAIRLTPELHQQIVDNVALGAYPHVAAAAAGVDPEHFHAWMERGRTPKYKNQKANRYKLFVRAVEKAQAMVRMQAESDVLKKDPLQWLRSGPGKETSGAAGWSLPAKPQEKGPALQVNLLGHPIVALILEKLSPYPEARAAAAEALFPPEPIPIRKPAAELSKAEVQVESATTPEQPADGKA